MLRPLIKFDSKAWKLFFTQPFSCRRILYHFVSFMNKTFHFGNGIKTFQLHVQKVYDIGTWWAGSRSGKPGFSEWPSFQPLGMIFVGRVLEGARHRHWAGLRWVSSKSTARSEQTFGCPMKYNIRVQNKLKLIT